MSEWHGLQQGLAVMVGAVALGGFILFAKGVYRMNDFMIWSGWCAFAAAVMYGAVWIMLGHCPLCAENAAAVGQVLVS